ncbi:MAG TPA: hypothetical protein VF681_01930 [Abditibacteriaceae bacterium]|jgi:hypothetical protein
MLFGFPLWAWLLVFVFFFVFPALARHNFRLTVRRELEKYIRTHHADVVITSQTEDVMNLRRGGTTAQLNLNNVYKAVASLRPHTRAARDDVFARFCAPIGSLDTDEKLTLETHGARILPRLVDVRFLNALPDRAELPTRALGFTGLYVAYVLDSPHHVAYLTRDQAEELNLDDRALHDLALSNLRARTDWASFEPARQALTVLQNSDGHDTARILLIPEWLPEGETLAAAIVARDILLLAPAPQNEDWATWHSLIEAAGNDAVGDRALKISSHGLEPAPLPVEK